MSRWFTHWAIRAVILLPIYFGYGNFHSLIEQRQEALAGNPTLVLPSGCGSASKDKSGTSILGDDKCEIPKKTKTKAKKKTQD
jgi:hypothetical protein